MSAVWLHAVNCRPKLIRDKNWSYAKSLSIYFPIFTGYDQGKCTEPVGAPFLYAAEDMSCTKFTTVPSLACISSMLDLIPPQIESANKTWFSFRAFCVCQCLADCKEKKSCMKQFALAWRPHGGVCNYSAEEWPQEPWAHIPIYWLPISWKRIDFESILSKVKYPE